MAEIATVLWSDFVKYDPNDAHWMDSDRVVLSNGHGSMLLYASLHLSGQSISLEDIKQFRQWGSVTAGHLSMDTQTVLKRRQDLLVKVLQTALVWQWQSAGS